MAIGVAAAFCFNRLSSQCPSSNALRQMAV
jgi:hypothetical protein